MSLPYASPFPTTSGLANSVGQPSSVSVVVPFFNEEECAPTVLKEVIQALPEAEVIAVDDGSSDGTWETISKLEGVTSLRLEENRGQSAALYAGMRAASGDLIALMDGDGQNDPADFPKLIDRLAEGDVDVVVGRRSKRKDTFSRRAASRIANRIRRFFLQDGVSDTGCSVKVFPKGAVDLLVPFNGLHRYLPAIFKAAGLRIAEIDVNHRPRAAGESKYTNWDRALRGLYDLIGVSWMLRRKLHFPPLQLKGPK